MNNFSSYNNWINESIKHLKPRSEEEIKSYYNNLTPDEKLLEGSRYGLLWLVKEALKEGADIHLDEDNALCWASYYGYYEIVKILLNAGANIHANNSEPLFWAQVYGNNKMVDLLKQYE